MMDTEANEYNIMTSFHGETGERHADTEPNENPAYTLFQGETGNRSGKRRCNCCFLPKFPAVDKSWLKIFFMWVFTDWPLQTIKYMCTISDDSVPPDGDNNSNCIFEYLINESVIIGILVMIIRLSFISIALFAQLMTCFRRDWITTNFTSVSFHNTSKDKLLCNDEVEVITGLLIPDIVVILLAFWLYFCLKFGSKYYSSCKCCGCNELKTVMKADTAKSLNKLVTAAKDKLKNSYVIMTYTLMAITYMVLSLLVSGIYLYVFKLAYDDVVIQSPLSKHVLGGKEKYRTIWLSFMGFIAFDLLYLQVMLRYAYRCQLILYCLKIIKDGVKKNLVIADKKDLKTKTKNAYTYIKELNTSSGTIALLIILAGFQGVNCGINLLQAHKTSYSKAAAVTARLVLWGFFFVFPFRKAAAVNTVSKRLEDLGWDVKIESCAHDGDSGSINLKANVFGIYVRPRLPFLVIILLLFTIMVGAKIKWYQLKI